MNTARHPNGHLQVLIKLQFYSRLWLVCTVDKSLSWKRRGVFGANLLVTLRMTTGQISPKAVQSSNSSGASHLEAVKTVKIEAQQWHKTTQADYGLDFKLHDSN